MAERTDAAERKAHALLMEAIELDPAARARFLEARCAGDARLRRSIDGLLAALEASQGFLERPHLETQPGRAGADRESIPPKIGPFRILRPIGNGGMARVFEAMQERPSRRVAVKLLKHGIRDAAARRRFEFETEVLARLRHPNIARIIEAGSHEDGSGAAIPYFAMEYVPAARTITAYADEEKLDLRARVELVALVCDAVQHGHDSGVIHRDLKPANILVDNLGHPKVIDFGIARSTDPDRALLTAELDPGRLVGTLHYMSPEQCAGAPDIDVRTDIYSLGMILYELLCGRRPHELDAVPIPEALRIVQREAPPRPSAHNPRVAGDLEAIVLTAIDKDPARRYRTAAAFEADLRRYLADRPIEARPPTMATQAVLFARRHRTLVAVGAVATSLLVVATVVSAALAMHARSESKRRRDAETAALAERDTAVRASYVARMQAARAALQFGEHAAARRSLAEAPIALRGWEWRLLSAWADRSAETLLAHRDQILAFALSPDRKRFATGSRDGTMRIWDFERRMILVETDEFDAWLQSIAFSPDGARIVAGSEDGALRIIDTASGRELMRRDDFATAVRSVAFGSDGLFVGCSADGVCLVFRGLDAPAARLAQEGGIHGAAATLDGRRLLTWNSRGDVAVRRMDDLSIERVLRFPGAVTCAASSLDGRLLAAAGAGGAILVWDAESGDARCELRNEDSTSDARCLAFAPDGTTLAAGFGDRQVRFFDLDACASMLKRIRGHEETVSGLAYDAAGETMITASWDRTVRVWTLRGPEHVEYIPSLVGHAGRVLAAAFSPDGAILASAGDDGAIRLWDPELAQPLGRIDAHRQRISAIAFSPDGRLIASASHDRTIALFDAASGVEVERLVGHAGHVTALAFSPDGGRLASGSEDATIRLWDLEGQRAPLLLEGHAARVQALAFHPDGRRLASGSRDHSVRVWTFGADGAQPTVRRLDGHTLDVMAVAYSIDGSTLFSGSRDQTVRAWDADGSALAVLDGHGQFVTALVPSPDGRRLAAASWFGEVLLWDLPTTDLILSFKAHESVVRGLAFDPSGRWLATASFDGTVRLMDDLSRAERLMRRTAVRAGYAAARPIVAALRAREADPAALLRAIERDDRCPPELRPYARRLVLEPSLTTSPSTPAPRPDEDTLSRLDASPPSV